MWRVHRYIGKEPFNIQYKKQKKKKYFLQIAQANAGQHYRTVLQSWWTLMQIFTNLRK